MPTLSQIPQTQVQFGNTNPDYSSVINSYQDYVNTIIRRDKENKTVFEQAQQQFDSILIGNGSDNDKEAYEFVNKKFGQKIHQLSNSANGLNGYANLTKQVESLQHEIVNDDIIQSLQTSFVQKQQLSKKVFGGETTEVILPDGTKTTKEVDNYPGWSQQQRQIEFIRSQKNTGVRLEKDEFGNPTGKVKYQSGDFYLPPAINLEERVRAKFAKEIQKYNNEIDPKTGKPFHTWEYPTQGMLDFGTVSEHGNDVDGLNLAIASYMKSDPEIQQYLSKKVELENYNPNTGEYNFSIKSQLEKDTKDVVTDLEIKFGKDGKEIYNVINELKKDPNRLKEFYKQNGITDSDIINHTEFDRIKEHHVETIIKANDIIARNYRLQNHIPIQQELTKEQDFELDRQVKLNKEIQSNILEMQNQNNALYGLKTYSISYQMIDTEERAEKRKKKEDEASKQNTSIQANQFTPIVGKDFIENDTKLELKSNELNMQMSKALSYTGKTPISELLKTNPNLLKSNPKLQELYNNYRLNQHELEVNKENIKDLDSTLKQVNVDEIMSFKKGEKDILKEAQTLSKSDFISSQLVKYDNLYKNNPTLSKSPLPRPTTSELTNLYNDSKRQLIDIANKKGLVIQSNGTMVMTDMSEQNKKPYDIMASNMLDGRGGVIISGGDFTDPVSADSEDWKKLIENEITNKDGSKNWNKLSIAPILDNTNKTKFSVIIGDKHYVVDATGADPSGQLQAIPIREQFDYLKKHVDENNNPRGITSQELDNRVSIAYSRLGSYLNGKQVIYDNNNKEIPIESQMPITALSSEVNNLKIGKQVEYLTSTGIKLYFKKIENTKGGENGNVELSMKDSNGRLRSFTFDNFESSLATASQMAALGKNDGSTFMSMINYANQK